MTLKVASVEVVETSVTKNSLSQDSNHPDNLFHSRLEILCCLLEVACPILNLIVLIRSDFALKDGAYYCYCAYVLRISRYSDFLSPVLTNTEIFLRGLKLSGESRS